LGDTLRKEFGSKEQVEGEAQEVRDGVEAERFDRETSNWEATLKTQCGAGQYDETLGLAHAVVDVFFREEDLSGLKHADLTVLLQGTTRNLLEWYPI
jgi:hypothetical protein